MPTRNKDPLLWAARHLSIVLAQRALVRERGEHFDAAVQSLLHHQLTIARHWSRSCNASLHGWSMAAAAERRLLGDLAQTAQYYVAQVVNHRPERTSNSPIGLRHLVEEIRQLDDEFEDSQITPQQRVISVVTECRALVIGVGAIGRQVAQQLAAVGIAQLDLIDFDQVAVENLAAQAYWPTDLGREKVHATADLCRSINPETQVHAHAHTFRRSSVKAMASFHDREHRQVVFCCVDSITTRKLIWEVLRERVALFIDGRMSAEVIRVLTASEPAQDHYHESTLFDASQAYAGACTARSTIYAASIAAGLMVGQFTKWLRDLPLERDQTLNLLAAELTVM